MLDAVFRTIDEKREVYIRELQMLCRQPSIGASGEGMTQTADMVEKIVRKMETRTQQIATDAYPAVLGERPGVDPRWVNLYNHYDVQPPDPVEAWTSDPFGAEIRDGVLQSGLRPQPKRSEVRHQRSGTSPATVSSPLAFRWIAADRRIGFLVFLGRGVGLRH